MKLCDNKLDYGSGYLCCHKEQGHSGNHQGVIPWQSNGQIFTWDYKKNLITGNNAKTKKEKQS